MLERAELEPWQARPRGYSRQKGRFIQGINQLKAAGWEKVVCLAARAALSFTTARRAHSLIYGRLQVIKEVSRRNDQATTFCHWTSFFRFFHVWGKFEKCFSFFHYSLPNYIHIQELKLSC